jgi:hypothetical protein
VKGRDRCVRGSGSGAVDAYDDLVDEACIRRGLAHHALYSHLPFAALTLAERCVVAERICARYPDYSDAAAWIGSSAHILRSYHHWAVTGEWITPSRVTDVLRQRAASGA